MKRIITLAALALAATIAVSTSSAVRADSHGGADVALSDQEFNQRLRELSDKQLRTLINNLKGRLDKRSTPVLRARFLAARQERARRKAGSAKPSKTAKVSSSEKQARRVLRNATPANRLATPDLKQRLGTLRKLVNSGDLSDGTRRKLSELYKKDSAEWKSRHAAKKPSGGEKNARRLLQGPATNDLRTPELKQRVRSVRDLLQNGDLRDRTRERLTALLRADRRELKRRTSEVKPAVKAERSALRLLQGDQASTLDTAQLRNRIVTGRKLLQSGQLSARTSNRLKKLVAADRTVLKARQTRQKVSEAERNARQHLDNAQPSRQLRAPQLRERMRQSREYLQFKELKNRTRRDLQELVRSDRDALENLNQEIEVSGAERQAHKLLADTQNPNRMPGRDLRRRIRDTRELLQETDITRKTRRRLQAQLEQDQNELRTRGAGNNQTNPADEQAQALLQDNSSAEGLSERQLKRRLRETRDLLQDPQLSKRNSRQLRARLRDDRRELRGRVETRRGDDIGIDDVIIGTSSSGANSVLGDRRPSHSLKSKQLSRRIKRTRNLLDGSGLSSFERSELTSALRSDRRELRGRLHNRRDRRRTELTRQRRNNEINIVIAPQFEYAPRDDVAAAEADDDIIERQLVAPPTREIKQRYSMDEFRRRPELRNYMPAVELDSIRFGFNEHFLREEEIDALERLGAIIERVITSNPNEVFLIEGHTDAVGSFGYNQSLSAKRADAVKTALLEFFVIDPANLSTIGYGEQFLKIPTEENEQENRRVTVRRITPLLANR